MFKEKIFLLGTGVLFLLVPLGAQGEISSSRSADLGVKEVKTFSLPEGAKLISFLPGSEKILYVLPEGKIALFDLKKNKGETLIEEGGFNPSLSPEGKKIAYRKRVRVKKIEKIEKTPQEIPLHLPKGMGIPFPGESLTQKPPKRGEEKVFFEEEEKGIWIFDIETRKEVNVLTRGDSPHWSPQGNWLIFWKEKKLWAINLENKNLVEIGENIRWFDFLPGGGEIVYIKGEKPSPAFQPQRGAISGFLEGRTPELYPPESPSLRKEKISGSLWVMELASGKKMKLSENVDAPVSFSPEGEKVVYSRGGRGIWVSFLDGKHLVKLSSEGTSPLWSPRLNKVVYLLGNTLWVIGEDLKTKPLVEETSPLTLGEWIGKGTKVIYSVEGKGIWMIDHDGITRLRLSSRGDYLLWNPEEEGLLWKEGEEFKFLTLKAKEEGVVLGMGKKEGIKKGMRINIYEERVNPFTGETIGYNEFQWKGEVIAGKVEEDRTFSQILIKEIKGIEKGDMGVVRRERVKKKEVKKRRKEVSPPVPERKLPPGEFPGIIPSPKREREEVKEKGEKEEIMGKVIEVSKEALRGLPEREKLLEEKVEYLIIKEEKPKITFSGEVKEVFWDKKSVLFLLKKGQEKYIEKDKLLVLRERGKEVVSLKIQNLYEDLTTQRWFVELKVIPPWKVSIFEKGQSLKLEEKVEED